MAPFKEETFTVEWKILSRKISNGLWANPLRKTQYSEATRSEDYEIAGAEYRALILRVLRICANEGIVFTEDESLSLSTSSDEWRKKTARLSWLLWSRSNKLTQRIPSYQENSAWEQESSEYRKFVRDALSQLAKSSVFMKQT